MGRRTLYATMMMWTAFLLRVAGGGQTILPGCQPSCGSVDIPYPFGMGTGCFRGLGFEILCNDRTPVLAATRPAIRVLQLSVAPRPEARVMLPVAHQCYDASGNVTAGTSYNGTVDLSRLAGVYRISDTANELFILGCDTFAYTNGARRPAPDDFAYYSGCVATCEDSGSARDGACAGVGCCHVDIPPGLADNQMYFSNGEDDWTHDGQAEYSPCDYAFIVEKGNYTFRKEDLRSMPLDTAMPLRLDWAIRDSKGSSRSMSCAQAPGAPGYTCVSDHSVCVDSANGPGYVCNCTQGYEGNPYLFRGCTNIDECKRPRAEFPCNGHCYDTEGSYNCKCPSGYESKGDPKENTCHPKFSLQARLALGISLGVLFLVVALLVAFIMIQKRKLDKLFEKNGGKKLENVKGLTIYTKKEIKKITKNNSELLGKGNFGEVYKGTLPDNTKVAVKSCIKEVTKATLAKFIEEVKIQTQMIHMNILKLRGCCLEVDMPVLVSEYAAEGSLHEILHEKKIPLDLSCRLDIAIGSAEGLKYMHTYANQAIVHGDVKPDNILLDKKFTPKISDFGLSRFFKAEYTVKVVVGCTGYLDPVFKHNGRLTQKSDVYSFGVVLLELISRKKMDANHERDLVTEFCEVYEKEKSGRAFFDKEIATEEDISVLEEIGKLAIECLNTESTEKRPDMTEVVEQLVMLRRARNLGNTD